MPRGKPDYLSRWKLRQEVAGHGVAEREQGDSFLGAPARAVVELDAKALRSNFLAIQELVPGQSILPMVKADGYGHGAAWVARGCLAFPALYGFGVATLREGAELREELGPRGRHAAIIVFSGACPWTEEKGQYCERHGLTPVIASESDWRTFLTQGWCSRIPYELKFNTGMNRLGIPAAMAGAVGRTLSSLPGESHPKGIFSHLAMAEDPSHKLSRAQRERFISLRNELASRAPAAHFHLANSAAIWNQKGWGLDGLTDVVRPGLSLYGIPPWDKAPARGIAPVLTFKASVLATHRLKGGESVGYGGRFKVPAGETAQVAILGAGYADGVSRELSGDEKGPGGWVWLGGKPERFLGRVSMDLSAVSCAPGTRVGEWAQLLGPDVDPWAQAHAAGTIPYELLTSITARVQRVYG